MSGAVFWAKTILGRVEESALGIMGVRLLAIERVDDFNVGSAEELAQHFRRYLLSWCFGRPQPPLW